MERKKFMALANLACLNDESEQLSAPILKWAGGKTQLLATFDNFYPLELKNGVIETYIEPFFGGGSVFFDIKNRFPIKKAFLFDINPELVCLYQTIKNNVKPLIKELKKIQTEYLNLDEIGRREYYYKTRDLYNIAPSQHGEEDVNRSAITIFLNRTCFNGLYRVNSSGKFNVPMGSYKNPTILFEEKLLAASDALSTAVIALGDFSKIENLEVDNKTFLYFDPPYRPISQTSQFTSYSADNFNDDDQRRLANLYGRLDKKGSFQMLSNSDPSNYIDDPFFDDLYKGFSINRIPASRRINSDSSKRGNVNELLITNYKTEA
jgi:DNA adenine methylase